MSEFRKYVKLIETYERIDESFKDAQAKFEEVEDSATVKSYIETFRLLSKQNKIKGQDKDIGKWIKAGWDDFKAFVDMSKEIKSKRSQNKVVKKDAIEIYKDDNVQAIVPLTTKASQIYGRNTKWCTASTEGDNLFHQYFYIDKLVLIYIIKDGEKFAIVTDHNFERVVQIFDSLDKSMEVSSFKSHVGYDPLIFVKACKPHSERIIEYSNPNREIMSAFKAIRKGNMTDKQYNLINNLDGESLYTYLYRKPSYVIDYIEKFQKHSRLLSKVLQRYPEYALEYAKRVSGESKWVEKIIKDNPSLMYDYIKNVTPDSYHKIEYLKSQPKYLYLYAKDIHKARLEHPEENILFNDDEYGSRYIENVIKYTDDYSSPNVLEYFKENGSVDELIKAYNDAIDDSPTGDDLLNMFINPDESTKDTSPENIIQSLEQRGYKVDSDFKEYIFRNYT